MLSAIVAREVIPTIARLCILKRTMATRIETPDGVSHIGGSVAPYFVHTIEVSLSPFGQLLYNQVHSMVARRLFRRSGATESNATDAAGATLNTAAFRRVCHAASLPALESVSRSLPVGEDNHTLIAQVNAQSDGGVRWLLDTIYTEEEAPSGMISAPDKIAEYLALRSTKLAALAAILRTHAVHRSGILPRYDRPSRSQP